MSAAKALIESASKRVFTTRAETHATATTMPAMQRRVGTLVVVQKSVSDENPALDKALQQLVTLP